MATVRPAGEPIGVRNREELLSSQLNDQISNLEKVIGKIPDVVKYDHVYNQSRAYSDLTELLLRRAPRVVDNHIRGLLVEGYHSELLHAILPIRMLGPNESIRVEWMQINFDPGYAPQVEVEGVAPVYTHNKSKRSARAVRRGAGLRIESGFYMTPEGQEEFRQKIQHLAAIIQRTNEMDAMMALLQAPLRAGRGADDMNGPYNVYGHTGRVSFAERMRLEVDMFGIVNKSVDSRGFANLVTNIRTVMQRNGVAPDFMICPPLMLSFFYSDKEDLWQYSSAGPQSLQNRANAADLGGGRTAVRQQQIQGMKVIDMHLYRPTNAANSPEAVDLLTVPKMIGEFYCCEANAVYPNLSDYKQYRGVARNLRIFNEKHGIMATVRFSDMVKNCLRWEDDAPGSPLQDEHIEAEGDIFLTTVDRQTRVVSRWYEVRNRYLDRGTLERVANTLVRVGGDVDVNNLASVLESLHDHYFKNDPVRTPAGATIVFQPNQGPAANEQYFAVKRQVIAKLREIFARLVDEFRSTSMFPAQGGRNLVAEAVFRGMNLPVQTVAPDANNPRRFAEAQRRIERDVLSGYDNYDFDAFLEGPTDEQLNDPNVNPDTFYLDPLRMILFLISDMRVGQDREMAYYSLFGNGRRLVSEHRSAELQEVLEKMPLLKRFMTAIWLLSPVNRDSILAQHEKDIFVPINFLLSRPYITMNVSSAVFCKGGTDLGETIIGNTDFQMTSNNMDRMIYGSMVYYGKSIVKNEKLVTVAPNVFINGYVKGNDTTFITRADLDEVAREGGLFESKNSILSFLVPVTEEVSRHSVIDIRGTHEQLQNDESASPTDPFFSSASYYRKMLNIEGSDLADPASPYVDYETMTYRANSICYRGHYEYGARQEFTSPNTGHLGMFTYNGCNQSRMPGSYAPTKAVQYSSNIVSAA